MEILEPVGPGVRRLVAVVDAEAYSGQPHPAQIALQHRIADVVGAGLAQAGVRRHRVDAQDRGDGVLLVLPAGIDEARAVPGLLRGLLAALAGDAERHDGQPVLRLRAALSQGVVHRAATGYVGRAVVDACRMVDADPVRTALRAAPDAVLGLVVEDGLYRDVVVHGYGGLPVDGFEPLLVPVKSGDPVPAWLWALAPGVLGVDRTIAGAALAVGGLPLGAAAFATCHALDEMESDDHTSAELRVDDIDDGTDHGTDDDVDDHGVDDIGDHQDGSP